MTADDTTTTDDEPVTGAAPHGIPEPSPAGSHVVQDNVTEPGVQRTRFPDGTEHVHYGDGRDNQAEDEAPDTGPDDGVGDQDGDGPVPDVTEVTVPIGADQQGWVTVPIALSNIVLATLEDGAQGTLVSEPSVDDPTATQLVVTGAAEGVTELTVKVTVAAPHAAS